MGALRIAEESASDPLESASDLLTRALYLGGDTSGLAAAVAPWNASRGTPAATVRERGNQFRSSCALAEWHLAAGRAADARPFVERAYAGRRAR
jgi:hypothetical protein